MKKVLCVSGKRFSGKDTFAALLQEKAREHGTTLVPYAFAGESKRLFAASDRSVDLDKLTNDRAYKEELRPRLTKFTVDSLAKDPLVFCKAVADRIEASKKPALITDMRLKVEIEHLKPRFDLHVVRISRSDEKRASSGWVFDKAKDEHHTETELDDETFWDEIVTNDGTLAELSLKAEKVLSVFLAP